MKLLRDILYKCGIQEVVGNTNVAIEDICFDSKKVEKFSLFIAIRGNAVDGHHYISDAIQKGAVAVVCEEVPDGLYQNITFVRVKSSRYALAHIAANFFDHPSQKLKIVGITGTNGKTSVATLSYQLFQKLGLKSGLISTVETRIGEQVSASTHTTPDPIALNKLFVRMLQKQCKYCFMEVSSHAIHQYRVEGVCFAGGLFTNISRDHLDYHKTFDHYINCKKLFFDELPETAFAIFNKDDKNGRIMVQNTQAQITSFGITSPATYQIKILENTLEGLNVLLDNQELWLQLTGKFNAYNAVAVYAIALQLQIGKSDALLALSSVKGAEGRFQVVKNNTGKVAIVDYAHTPDALKNVLETIHDIKGEHQKIITVIGCGGNRDKGKRPQMGKIAADYSSQVILTSDNPRNEDPKAILEEIKAGITNTDLTVISIEDRREAINTALALAQKDDVVLVAGKGHEKYQEINGVKYPFDDVEVIKNLLNPA